jgi:hypothetical protein
MRLQDRLWMILALSVVFVTLATLAGCFIELEWSWPWEFEEAGRAFIACSVVFAIFLGLTAKEVKS